MKTIYLNLTILFLIFSSSAFAKTYNLEIKKQKVFITGKAVEAITINDSIPGPNLHWQEGEDVIVNVRNSMDETTSIHWHGILLDGAMDGVPGLNGFHGITPHSTFTYKFRIRQAGTYWYHSHSNLQEQQGAYGAIVIKPKKEIQKFDREYVVLLSDFTEENPATILNNLKIDSGYYNYNKRTVSTFFTDAKNNGFFDTLKDYMNWGEMRMDPTDLSDVSKYNFLINGKVNDNYFLFKKGEKIKLRFINASAMTIYDVSIPGLKLKFMEADGQPIKPITRDEFRFGVAETYDVIVEPKKDKAYTIFAESLDRTGYALGILAPPSCATDFSTKNQRNSLPLNRRNNLQSCNIEIPKMRERAVLTMADMGMHHHMDRGDMSEMDHSPYLEGKSSRCLAKQDSCATMEVDNEMNSGWSDRGTPKGNKALEYSDLVSLYPQKDLREPTREIEFKFGGTMSRYIWTINGEKFPKPFSLKYGEHVRLKFTNETMMAHPIHLHGMFMQMENGENMRWLPNKHTVIVPPAQTVTMLLTANETGEWAFHCHLLYHMASGMMTSVTVEKGDEK